MADSIRSIRRILVFVASPATCALVLGSAFGLAKKLVCDRITVIGGSNAGDEIRRRVRARTGMWTPSVDIMISGASDPVTDAVVEAGECDLIVTGEAGMITQQLLRRAPRPILSLPSTGACGPGPVLVPVDFFEDSRRAAQFGAELAELDGTGIDLLHVYSVPLGWHKLGPSYVEIARRMRAQAGVELDRFAVLAPPGGRRLLRLASHAASGILKEARRGRHAQIVLAARRRGPFVALMFGSVAERVVLSSPIPVWVIRDEAPLTWTDAAL